MHQFAPLGTNMGGGNHARQGDLWGGRTDTRDTEEAADGTVIGNSVQKKC
jgi:hypothetical protein